MVTTARGSHTISAASSAAASWSTGCWQARQRSLAPRSARSLSWHFRSPTVVPPGKPLPSWAVVATADKAAGTDVVRSMAVRAGATMPEVDGSHEIMISPPQIVADVLLGALAHTNSEPTLTDSGV